jgi:murein DD-endopeptidase MepM/ murein hydrolase activator NlpD
LKRLIFVSRTESFGTQSYRLDFKQLATKISKLIGTTIIIWGIFTPVPSVKANINLKPNSGNVTLDIGEAYSVLVSAIADYTSTNAIKNISELPTPYPSSNNIPETVIANQPIPEVFTSSLVGKSEPDSSSAKLEFEPLPDLSKVSEVVSPVLFEHKTTGQTLTQNVLMTIKPLQLLAMESNLFSAKPLRENLADTQKLNTISSQLIENLESGIEAIVGNNKLSSALAPELPTLVAKVYLPETSDYGLSSGFVWPAQGLLTSQFGWRWGRLHQGVDIAAPIGTPIWATGNGIIDFAGWNSGGYGKMVDILHPNGTISRYAHLNAIFVKRGQSVNQSQVIATMGNTGNSTGPHLHFEIRPNGRTAINPMTFLARIISKG